MTDSRTLGTPAQASGRRFPDSVETRGSWIAATLAIAILSISYGAPLIVVIGLKPIAAALDADRSVVALAAALVWVGTGTGGILMGWVADRVGVRRTVIFGAVMTAIGLAVSATGRVSTLYLGHALLIGFLGGGALYPPLLIYISRWFDRRRGTALALISSGQYIAGVIWPSVFERALIWFGWRGLMLGFSLIVLLDCAVGRLGCDRPHSPVALQASPASVFSGQKRWASALTPCSCCCVRRHFCAVCRWRCRRATSSPFAAMSASPLPKARRCSRYCSAALLSAASFGAGRLTGLVGSARSLPAQPVRRWRSPPSR